MIGKLPNKQKQVCAYLYEPAFETKSAHLKNSI